MKYKNLYGNLGDNRSDRFYNRAIHTTVSERYSWNAKKNSNVRLFEFIFILFRVEGFMPKGSPRFKNHLKNRRVFLSQMMVVITVRGIIEHWTAAFLTSFSHKWQGLWSFMLSLDSWIRISYNRLHSCHY